RPVSTGESWSEFMFRACTALNRITQKYAGKTVVLVAHGGIIEASFLFFSGLNILAPTPIFIDPAYTSITHWQKARGLTQDRWRLERYNDALHLAPWLTAKP
ncbi:MAG TPA: histidine phosphatase family protein, partial [Phototrophicaceae bacterium]|nr:histidine phosphatase family protein [Phototrophicaceae bacterium]